MQNAFLDRQRKALADLAQLVARRAAGEQDIDRRHAARAQEIVDQHKAQREQLTAEFEKEITALRGEYRQLREEAIFQYESTSYSVVQQAEKFDKDAAEELERGQERAKRQFQITQRTATDEFDQNKDKPGQDCDRIRRRCLGRLEEIEEVGRQAQKVLRRRKCVVPEDAIATAELAADADPHDHFTAALTAAKARLQHMIRQPAARFLEDGWPFLIFLFASAALAWPAVHWLGWGWGIGACLAAGAIIGLGVRQFVRPLARRQTLVWRAGDSASPGRRPGGDASRDPPSRTGRPAETGRTGRETRTHRERGPCALGPDPRRTGGTASGQGQASGGTVPRPPQGIAGDVSPHAENARRKIPAPDRPA